MMSRLRFQGSSVASTLVRIVMVVGACTAGMVWSGIAEAGTVALPKASLGDNFSEGTDPTTGLATGNFLLVAEPSHQVKCGLDGGVLVDCGELGSGSYCDVLAWAQVKRCWVQVGYSAGRHTFDFKAVDGAGQESATGHLNFRYVVPATGIAGVSINAGALYTNTTNVDLLLGWPKDDSAIGGPTGGFTMRVSNDGGFFGAPTVAIDTSLSWRLRSSGSERLPKTVYVRFGTSSTTFTDDIILDQTAPVVDSASGTPTTVLSRRGNASAAKPALPAVKLTLKARDTNSGVGKVQITTDKTQAGLLVNYATSITFKRASTSVKTFYVRVQDKAKNYSAWKTVTVK